METFMLEGWTPILFSGIAFALIMFIASRKITIKSLLTTSAILSLICIAILYSIVGLGGWDGMGLGVFTTTVLIGIWIGTSIGAITKRKKI